VFEPFGAVDNIKILQMKNCAFVRYQDLDSAQKAHAAGQNPGIFLRGIPVRVGWGKSDGPSSHQGGFDRPHREDNMQPTTKLWVGNIEPGTTEDEVRGLFSQFGPIERIKVLSQKNCAFVDFTTIDHALAAKQHMNGVPFKSSFLRINFGRDDPNRDRPPRQDNFHWTAPGLENNRGGQDRQDRGDRGGGDRFGGDRGGGGFRGRGRDRSPDKSLQPPAPPTDMNVKSIIDKFAVAVAKAGPSLEEVTLQKSGNDPRFAFLKEDHEHHLYYRFRIFEIKNPGVVRLMFICLSVNRDEISDFFLIIFLFVPFSASSRFSLCPCRRWRWSQVAIWWCWW
jgi:RNA recognition motif-containing protein